MGSEDVVLFKKDNYVLMCKTYMTTRSTFGMHTSSVQKVGMVKMMTQHTEYWYIDAMCMSGTHNISVIYTPKCGPTHTQIWNVF